MHFAFALMLYNRIVLWTRDLIRMRNMYKMERKIGKIVLWLGESHNLRIPSKNNETPN